MLVESSIAKDRKSVSYKEHIKLVGFTNDVQSYLNRSDIFLFPSYGEGLGNAFIEALSNNLVCISYNNTSFSELQNLGFYFKMCEERQKYRQCAEEPFRSCYKFG